MKRLITNIIIVSGLIVIYCLRFNSIIRFLFPGFCIGSVFLILFFEKKLKSQNINVFIIVVSCSLFSFTHSENFELLKKLPTVCIIIPVGISIVSFIIYYQQTDSSKRLLKSILISFCVFLISIGQIVFVDIAFDKSIPKEYEAVIIEKYNYGDWFGSHSNAQATIFSEQLSKEESIGVLTIKTSGNLYEQLENGDVVRIVVKGGFLRIKYYYLHQSSISHRSNMSQSGDG